MTVRLRGGASAEDPRLDRVYQPDERNEDYPLRAVVAGRTPRSYGWPCPIRLDQGREGACTGFAAAYDLAASPVAIRGVNDALAQRIYEEARRQDEWPGEAYDGSSVLGAAKALAVLGYIGEYRWAGANGSSAIDDVILALGYVGGVVFGTDVTDDWYEPGGGGIIGTTGRIIGGHSYLARGVLVTRDGQRRRLGSGVPLRESDVLLYGPNSWSWDWGYKGEWAMWASDMQRLLDGLQYPGEARVTTQAYRKAV